MGKIIQVFVSSLNQTKRGQKSMVLYTQFYVLEYRDSHKEYRNLKASTGRVMKSTEI